MLHINFQGHRPFGFREEEFFMFLPYMGMAAILVMWPGPFEQTFVPPSHGGSTSNLALFGQAGSQEKQVWKGWTWSILVQGRWMTMTFDIRISSCTHLVNCIYQLWRHRLHFMTTERPFLFAYMLQVSKRSLRDFIHILMILYMYIAPGQGQKTPWGQTFDVNRKPLSLRLFIASFKQISLNSDFTYIF